MIASTYSLLFLLRIGIVEAQMAHAAVVARKAEVQADGLRVADVQIAVRLRRKAGPQLCGIGERRTIDRAVERVRAALGRLSMRHAETRGISALREVAFDDVTEEVRSGRGNRWGGRRRNDGRRTLGRLCSGYGHVRCPGEPGIVIKGG